MNYAELDKIEVISMRFSRLSEIFFTFVAMQIGDDASVPYAVSLATRAMSFQSNQ